MRFGRLMGVVTGLALAVTVPAHAGAAVTDLSGNELPLRIHAQGTVTADQVRYEFPLQVNGDSKEVAEAGLRAQETELRDGLQQLGVDPSRVTITPGQVEEIRSEPWYVETEAAVAVADAAADVAGVESAAPVDDDEPAIYWKATAIATVALSFEEAARITGSDRLSTSDFGGSNPQFTFADENRSHQQAVSLAIANARQQAENYASVMGYKIVRVAGVNNAGPPLSAHEMISMIAKIDRPSREWSLIGAMTAEVTVDYVIAPK